MRKPKMAIVASFTALVLCNVNCSSGCENDVVQRQDIGGTEISLVRRVCGSVAGYNLSIKPRGLDTTGIAAEYEPFMMVCDCYTRGSPAPAAFAISGSTIKVRYDQSKVWQMSKQRTQQGAFTIAYEAYGVAPEQMRR